MHYFGVDSSRQHRSFSFSSTLLPYINIWLHVHVYMCTCTTISPLSPSPLFLLSPSLLSFLSPLSSLPSPSFCTPFLLPLQRENFQVYFEYCMNHQRAAHEMSILQKKEQYALFFEVYNAIRHVHVHIWGVLSRNLSYFLSGVAQIIWSGLTDGQTGRHVQ